MIFTHRALREVRLDHLGVLGGGIYAEAGVASPKVARYAALNELAGAEFLAGIPGTVGGALAMNAGCYGGETWDIVAHAHTIDRAGKLRVRTPGDYEIGYRHVRLKPDSPFPREEWFVAAIFNLKRGSGAESRGKITELLKRRIATQPLDEPNAGSVFRNPQGDYAARLIEACGLKGRVDRRRSDFGQAREFHRQPRARARCRYRGPDRAGGAVGEGEVRDHARARSAHCR